MKPLSIKKTDRQVAVAILMTLARHHIECHDEFSLSDYYDYDQEFISKVSQFLNLPRQISYTTFLRRLRRVVRRLVTYGILYGRYANCHKDSIGEPKMIRQYGFTNPSYASRLAPDIHPNYKPMGEVSTEIDFLLRNAYPL